MSNKMDDEMDRKTEQPSTDSDVTVKSLKRLFPTLDHDLIVRVLRKKNGNIQAAMDVLDTLIDDDNTTSGTGAASNTHIASPASTNRQQSQHQGVVGNSNVSGRNIIGSNVSDVINDVHAPVNVTKNNTTSNASPGSTNFNFQHMKGGKIGQVGNIGTQNQHNYDSSVSAKYHVPNATGSIVGDISGGTQTGYRSERASPASAKYNRQEPMNAGNVDDNNGMSIGQQANNVPNQSPLALPSHQQDDTNRDHLSFSINVTIQKISESDLQWGQPLGHGSYGAVMQAKWKNGPPSCKDVAVKTMSSTNSNVDVKKEIKMLKRSQHPNIVDLFGYGRNENGHYYIVMELMRDGTLYHALHEASDVRLTNKQLANWAHQLAYALDYMHQIRVFHRDLKTKNILLTNGSERLKIADFGSVRDIDHGKYTTNVGTRAYMAPEVFRESNYTEKCDVYSFGIILCEMFTRQRPYAHAPEILEDMKNNPGQFFGRISSIDSPLRPKLTSDVPETIKTIIESCWATKSDERPPILESLTTLRRIVNGEILLPENATNLLTGTEPLDLK